MTTKSDPKPAYSNHITCFYPNKTHSLDTNDIIHLATSYPDNTNWGRRCLRGWLGSNPRRWDVITFNFGLHDLAFPDNEHLGVDTYKKFLTNITTELRSLARSDARLSWVTTTAVPTNPPPQKGKNPVGGDNCTLVPGRTEVNVLRYNAAAAAVMTTLGVPTCDLVRRRFCH